jgi:hypothetical protein
MSEEAMGKSGPELFKELLRVYETVEVDDYYKAGKWKDDLLRTDLTLILAHRKEAGAPDPPALEDVVLPEMPATGPTLGGVTSLTAASPGAAATGPVAELRLIALFVAKWKLDPTKAKAALSKLLPNRRRYVIQNFKATSQGDAGCAELDTFIAECGKNGSWDKAVPPAAFSTPVSAVRPLGVVARPVGVVGGVGVSGLKRPLTPVNPALDPSKRPRIGVPAVVPAAGGALAARLAAARSGVRPAAVLASPRAVTAPAIRPVVQVGKFGAVRPPVRPVAPKAFGKPAGAPGALIKGLLNKF